MNDEQRFDRTARTWLEDGPTRAPDRAVDAALLRIQTLPQERDLRIPWRLPKMTTPARVAAAAVIGVLAVGGALYALAPGSSGPGGPGPAVSPTPSPPPSASASPSTAPSASAVFPSWYTGDPEGGAGILPAGEATTRFFQAGLRTLGFDIGLSESPITPVIVGEGAKAMQLSDRLFAEGVFAQGIAFPTVARDRARVRAIVTATHTRDELQFALDAFAKVGRELGLV